MKTRGLDKSNEDEVLFDYDPETDGADEADHEQQETESEDATVMTDAEYKDHLELEYYTSHQRVLSSDHKPLDATFTLHYQGIDPALKAAIHQEVARDLDKAENEGRPTITIAIDQTEDGKDTGETLEFGGVRYDHPEIRSVTIANTGQVPATFSFVDRYNSGICPRWLDIQFDRPGLSLSTTTPAKYTLEPGDAINVQFALRISSIEDVRALNEGTSKIEDVLVLRVHNGRDHFLPVHASWLQSSFGRSLEKLTRISEGGVRNSQHQHPVTVKHETARRDSDGVKWSAPREIFRLTESLEGLVERAVAEWGMMIKSEPPVWSHAGWPFLSETWKFEGEARDSVKYEVREALDLGVAFKFEPEILAWQRVEVLAETLLTFLDSLVDGVVNDKLWHEISTGLQERERLKKSFIGEGARSWILDVISTSPVHSVSFTFLTFMLGRIADDIAPPKSMNVTPVTPKPTDGLMSNRAEEDPWRRTVNEKFADIFAQVIFKSAILSKSRNKPLDHENRKKIVKIFLK
jgi:hypothetical protein